MKNGEPLPEKKNPVLDITSKTGQNYTNSHYYLNSHLTSLE